MILSSSDSFHCPSKVPIARDTKLFVHEYILWSVSFRNGFQYISAISSDDLATRSECIGIPAFVRRLAADETIAGISFSIVSFYCIGWILGHPSFISITLLKCLKY